MAKLSRVKNGSVLVELIVAMGLFMIVVPGILHLATTSYVGNLKNEDNLQALAYAREGIEASVSIRDYNWNNLSVGQHGLSDSSGYWQFSGTEDSRGKFTRSVEVSTIDNERKSVDLTVSWDTHEGLANTLTLNSELSDWQNFEPIVPTCEESPCSENRVFMCHYTGGGSGSTSCLGSSARLSHWAHGDTCGPC